tara:strand:+ start:171 stop:401 length:231 start_codon:yes stop_codon:yes gene_type:complete
MNKKDKLRKILIEVLELDAKNLPEIINVDNSEKWDSIGHYQIIEKLENEFNLEIEVSVVVELLGEEEILNYLNKTL